MSSRFEGFGLVVIESFSLGTPVISFDIVGPSELVRHEVNGLLVEPLNARGLSAALSDLLSNPAKRQTFAENAFIDLPLFNPDSVFAAWEEAILSTSDNL
ncbi:glycosyltransferase [Ectothiorhodospira shaposhnikovii]|nr:glycosyltransferase [Ectothiorhodospira shaposhnikovii]